MSERVEQLAYCYRCREDTMHFVTLLDSGNTEYECTFCGKIEEEPAEDIQIDYDGFPF